MLEDQDVGLISKQHSFFSFFKFGFGALSSTGPNWHMSLLVQKKENFSSKQKGGMELKFRTTNRGPAYPVFRQRRGREEEGEEKLRWRGEE